MNVKKIVGILILITSIIVILPVGLMFNAIIYGYYGKEARFYSPRPAFLKKELYESIRPEYLFTDWFNDSISYFKYKQNTELTIWKLNKFDLINIRNVLFSNNGFLNNEKPFGDGVNYGNVGNKTNPTFILQFRTKMKDSKILRIEADNDSKIDTVLQMNNYFYCTLNFNQLKLYGNDGLDISINKLPQLSNVNFMVLNYNGAFYIILFYSLDGANLKKDALFTIINTG